MLTYTDIGDGSYEVHHDQYGQIAGLDPQDPTDPHFQEGYLVVYGPAFRLEHAAPTLEAAKAWIEENLGDIADGVELDR